MLKRLIVLTFLCIFGMSLVSHSDNHIIEVIGINNDYPYLYTDKDGIPNGFIVDFLDHFSQDVQKEVRISLYEPSEALDVFEERGDILYYGDFKIDDRKYGETVPIDIKDFHIYYNKSAQTREWESQAFYEDIKPLVNVKMGIRRGQENIGYIEKISDPANLKIYDYYSELLNDLNSGELDVAILPYYQVNHLIKLNHFENIEWLDTPVFYQDITFKAKTNNMLDDLSIDILHDKKAGFLSETHKKWFEVEIKDESNSKSLFYFNVALAFLALLLISMVTWNGALQKKVHERTIRLEEEIEKNKELYESVIEKEKFKNDYFMNLSHELRTPLNIILSAVQLNDSYIKNDDFEKVIENAQSYTEIIRNNSYRLLRVVNNLIDINKMETGSYPLNIDYVDVVHLTERIVKSIYPFVNAKGIRLKISSEYEEIFVECDPFEVERVVLNLLSNAIKFTDKNGEIQVKIVKNQIHKEAVISVKDNGVGIAKQNQERIFEKYTQVNTDLTRSHEGNGLGLSLVRSIVEMHGGSLNLFSELGVGSEFTIHLPLKTGYKGKIDKRKDFVYQLHSEDKRINLELADLESTVDHSN